jgi:hypothetical protein
MSPSPVPTSFLVVLANRCLNEPASRALDTEIYCAIHGIPDGNDLGSPALVEARAKGDVLIVEPGLQCWVEAPPFTEDLKYARSLVPEGLYTISRDPRIVCAAALAALAITEAPPLPQHGFLNESWA